MVVKGSGIGSSADVMQFIPNQNFTNERRMKANKRKKMK